jgi:hypothetical protein
VSERKFCGTTTCDECPWRKDVPPGRFPPERFERLRGTSEGADWFKPIFACHKSPEGQEFACVGYLMVCGWGNLSVRMAASSGQFNPRTLVASAPLYETYEEMAIANGVEF